MKNIALILILFFGAEIGFAQVILANTTLANEVASNSKNDVSGYVEDGKVFFEIKNLKYYEQILGTNFLGFAIYNNGSISDPAFNSCVWSLLDSDPINNKAVSQPINVEDFEEKYNKEEVTLLLIFKAKSGSLRTITMQLNFNNQRFSTNREGQPNIISVEEKENLYHIICDYQVQ